MHGQQNIKIYTNSSGLRAVQKCLRLPRISKKPVSTFFVMENAGSGFLRNVGKPLASLQGNIIQKNVFEKACDM
jgi:hypothetical protein